MTSMAIEMPLFEPLTKRADPVTSYRAAESLHRSGKLAGQKKLVLEALRKKEGATSAELADFMRISRYITARRLPDLERAGMIKKGKSRTCLVTKSQCVTWFVKK